MTDALKMCMHTTMYQTELAHIRVYTHIQTHTTPYILYTYAHVKLYAAAVNQKQNKNKQLMRERDRTTCMSSIQQNNNRGEPKLSLHFIML